MGKKLNDRIEGSANELANILENYIFMQRLRESGNESLISNFETRGFNTIRSKTKARSYMKFFPTNEELTEILATITTLAN